MRAKLCLAHRWLLLGALLASAGVAGAQPFWEKKDYRQWTEAECRKLLSDSPWAKTYTISIVLIELMGVPTGEHARETNPRMEYVVQLRSALPVRQALVRLQMLELEYEKMSAEAREAFDQDAKKFLETQFPEQVVVYVEYGSNVNPHSSEMARYWQTHTTDLAQNSFSLIAPDGRRYLPLRYVATQGAGRSFQLTFPRLVDGEPLLSARNPREDAMSLELAHPSIASQRPARVFVTFKSREMIWQDQVNY